MTIDLEPLPFAEDALEPIISARSVQAHRVLEARYVDAVNRMAGPRYVRRGVKTLDDVVAAARHLEGQALWEQASQAWNHRFWWEGLRAPWRSKLPPMIRTELMISFKHMGPFVSSAQAKARRLFGSGWLWLAKIEGRLQWVAAENAARPVRWPVLVVDVWEHAYWLDYAAESVYGPSSRELFVEAVLNNLVNWEVVEERLKRLL